MKKIRVRLGKDVVINWPILTNGQTTSLEGRDLTLVRKEPNGKKKEMSFETQGNILATTFRGTSQNLFGEYSFTLWENYGKNGQTLVDSSDILLLVPSTQCEDTPTGTNINVSYVTLSAGQMIVGAKGEKGEKGDKGDKGDKGEQGVNGVGISSVTPSISISDEGRVVRTQTIRLTNNAEFDITSIDGLDGEQGPKGSKGADADIEGCNQAISRANTASAGAEKVNATISDDGKKIIITDRNGTSKEAELPENGGVSSWNDLTDKPTNLATTEQLAGKADSSQVADLVLNIGQLSNLQMNDKSSIVNAMNEVDYRISVLESGSGEDSSVEDLSLTESDFVSGFYTSALAEKDNTTFVRALVDVTLYRGKKIYLYISNNNTAPCSWLSESGEVTNLPAFNYGIAVFNEIELEVPSDATKLYVNNNLRELESGYYVKTKFSSSGGSSSGNPLSNYVTKTELAELTESIPHKFNLKPIDFKSGYYNSVGELKANNTFVCAEVDVTKYRGKNIIFVLSCNNAAPCSWVADNNAITTFIPNSTNSVIEVYIEVPQTAKTLLVNNNMNSIPNGFYVKSEDELGQSRMLEFATDWEGKNFTSYGDSLTSRAGWQEILVKHLRFASHTNCGIGGSWTGKNNGVKPLVDDDRIATLPTDSDILTIMCGTNDFYGNCPIGEHTHTNIDTSTYFGALNVVSNKVKARCPNARIVFMHAYCQRSGTLPSNWGSDGLINANGNTPWDFRDAMKKCASMHGIPFIDLTGEMNVDSVNVARYYSADSTESGVVSYSHPNDLGKLAMAKIIYCHIVNM